MFYARKVGSVEQVKEEFDRGYSYHWMPDAETASEYGFSQDDIDNGVEIAGKFAIPAPGLCGFEGETVEDALDALNSSHYAGWANVTVVYQGQYVGRDNENFDGGCFFKPQSVVKVF